MCKAHRRVPKKKKKSQLNKKQMRFEARTSLCTFKQRKKNPQWLNQLLLSRTKDLAFIEETQCTQMYSSS